MVSTEFNKCIAYCQNQIIQSSQFNEKLQVAINHSGKKTRRINSHVYHLKGFCITVILILFSIFLILMISFLSNTELLLLLKCIDVQIERIGLPTCKKLLVRDDNRSLLSLNNHLTRKRKERLLIYINKLWIMQ